MMDVSKKERMDQKEIRTCKCGFVSRHPRHERWQCIVCKQKSENKLRNAVREWRAR